MKEQLQLKNHLKEVRIEANLSQAQLAEMVGVSRNTISSIVRMNCADIAFDIYNSQNRYEHSQNQHYNIFHNDLLKIQ